MKVPSPLLHRHFALSSVCEPSPASTPSVACLFLLSSSSPNNWEHLLWFSVPFEPKPLFCTTISSLSLVASQVSIERIPSSSPWSNESLRFISFVWLSGWECLQRTPSSHSSHTLSFEPDLLSILWHSVSFISQSLHPMISRVPIIQTSSFTTSVTLSQLYRSLSAVDPSHRVSPPHWNAFSLPHSTVRGFRSSSPLSARFPYSQQSHRHVPRSLSQGASGTDCATTASPSGCLYRSWTGRYPLSSAHNRRRRGSLQGGRENHWGGFGSIGQARFPCLLQWWNPADFSLPDYSGGPLGSALFRAGNGSFTKETATGASSPSNWWSRVILTHLQAAEQSHALVSELLSTHGVSPLCLPVVFEAEPNRRDHARSASQPQGACPGNGCPFRHVRPLLGRRPGPQAFRQSALQCLDRCLLPHSRPLACAAARHIPPAQSAGANGHDHPCILGRCWRHSAHGFRARRHCIATQLDYLGGPSRNSWPYCDSSLQGHHDALCGRCVLQIQWRGLMWHCCQLAALSLCPLGHSHTGIILDTGPSTKVLDGFVTVSSRCDTVTRAWSNENEEIERHKETRHFYHSLRAT